MKLRNFNLSLFILIGLMLLSFAFFVVAQEASSTNNNVFLDSDQDGLTDAEEKTYGTNPQNSDTDNDGYSDFAEIKGGYDPKKPAPGDKLVESAPGSVLGQDNTKNEENMTENISQKISELTLNSNNEEQTVTIDKIKSMVSDSMNSASVTEELPEIKDSDIKIKKQDYNGLSAEKTKEKKKEDFINYITAAFYVISSNSPYPLTSATNISNVILELTQDITISMISRDPSNLEDLSKSGQKMLEQLKEVEVPEEMVETHKKAMRYAMYSQKLKDYIKSNPDDPVKDIANFSKIQAFISSLSQFSGDIETKFTEYGISYDDTIKNKLKSLGINPPDIDESTLSSLSDVLTETSSSASNSDNTSFLEDASDE